MIVTIDDDIRYHPTMLADLLRTHQRVSGAIIANSVRKVRLWASYSE